MKTYQVYHNGPLLLTLRAERVYVSDGGRLSFFNVSTRKDVAGFTPDAWSFYAEQPSA